MKMKPFNLLDFLSKLALTARIFAALLLPQAAAASLANPFNAPSDFEQGVSLGFIAGSADSEITGTNTEPILEGSVSIDASSLFDIDLDIYRIDIYFADLLRNS